MFSLPSDSRTSRFWPVSGKAAVPSRIAPARSVRSVPTTAWIFSTLTNGLTDDSMLASLPKTSTPALSTAFFRAKASLTYSRAASCWDDGMLSERSRTKKTFMPSIGRSHCKPASANPSASTMTRRTPSAIQRRTGLTCTSDFHASHTTQPTAGSINQSQTGFVNWTFTIFGSPSVVWCFGRLTRRSRAHPH